MSKTRTGKFRSVLLLALFLAVFSASSRLLVFLLKDDVSSYTRVMMHELHTDRSIDTLFVGSSHVYRSLIPSIVDEGMDCHSFNAGTSQQRLDGSFALIKEAAAGHDLKRVYLELYYGIADEPSIEERQEMRSTYIISDYMAFSPRRFLYLAAASPKSSLINSFFPPRRDWTALFDPPAMLSRVKQKLTPAYRTYEWIPPEGTNEFYTERGFVANTGSFLENTVWNEAAAKPIDLSTEIYRGDVWYGNLKRIDAFCRKKGIELILFVAPEPEQTIAGKGNYGDCHRLLAETAAGLGLPFYDFNCCRTEFFDAGDASLFKDADHLNTLGAEAFSRIFASFFSGQISEEALFFSSPEEKLDAAQVPFYCIAGPKVDDSGNRQCRIVTGCDDLTFTVEAAPYGEESAKLPLLPDGRTFVLPKDSAGELLVTWTDPASGDTQTIHTQY